MGTPTKPGFDPVESRDEIKKALAFLRRVLARDESLGQEDWGSGRFALMYATFFAHEPVRAAARIDLPAIERLRVRFAEGLEFSDDDIINAMAALMQCNTVATMEIHATVKRRNKPTVAERNVRVREYLVEHKNRTGITAREVAKKIGCSAASVTNSQAWKAFADYRRQRAQGREVSLTQAMEAGAGQEDTSLANLIREQQQDETSTKFYKSHGRSRRIAGAKIRHADEEDNGGSTH